MTTYYRLEPALHDLYGIAEYPQLPEDVSFIAGRTISEALPAPLVFAVNHPQGETPKHFLGMQVPVVSDLLLRVIRETGADNVQAFPAVLRNPDTGATWTGYHALNVIGMPDAADLRASKYEEIMPGNDEVPALLDFTKLVIDGSRTRNLLLFRLAQSPRAILAHESVRARLRQRRPPEGWGITTFEVPAR